MGYILIHIISNIFLPLGRMTGYMDIMCIVLFGEATSQSRGRLFNNNATVEVKGDDGQVHLDWEELLYSSIIKAFSHVDDHVYLPRIVSGKRNIP